MKIVSLAAGVAVGYVLGSRAGRDKYEQIVAGIRRMSSQPGVPTKTEEPLGADPVAPAPIAGAADPLTAAAGPRPPRRRPATPAAGTATGPLV